VFDRYESAEQHFSGVVNGSAGRSERFKCYVWVAAFGQGLAEGLNERQIVGEPRPISNVAIAAKDLYESFLSFAEMPSTAAKYRTLGKSYAVLRLEDESRQVLDFNFHSDILIYYKLYPTAKKLCRDEMGIH